MATNEIAVNTGKNGAAAAGNPATANAGSSPSSTVVTLPFLINGLAQVFAVGGTASPVINALNNLIVITGAGAAETINLPTPTASQLAQFAAGGQITFRILSVGGIVATTFGGTYVTAPSATALALANSSIEFEWNGTAYQQI